jgi:pyridoxal/pyridoxine/pyridoxamine kinase
MVQHQRVKNLAVKENINTQQAGLSNVIVTDSHNDKAEREFLELLKIKKELGVISEEDIKQLVPGNTDPVERLTIDILKNLNKYSSASAEFKEICQVMQSTSRVQMAKKLAERYVAASQLKRIVARTIGRPQNELGSVGDSFVAADLGRQAANLGASDPMRSQSAADRDAFTASQQ